MSESLGWNDAQIARLRDLWAQGLSTRQIAKVMGASKNAVVGKAHRLRLAARPSPIKRDCARAEWRQRPRRVGASSLDALPSVAVAPDKAPPVLRPAPQPVAPVVWCPPRYANVNGRIAPCLWPVSADGERPMRFCDGTSVPGKPYCADHCGIAYLRVRVRREDCVVAP